MDHDFRNEQEAYQAIHSIEIVNIEKISQIAEIKKLLKYWMDDEDVTFVSESKFPYGNWAYIRLTGKSLNFWRAPVFARLAKFATGFEVYPKTDGTVQMDFTFHNLTEEFPLDKKGGMN